MRRMRRSSVLLAVLLLIPNTQGAVTCKASTTIKQTTVTCYFGMDISKTNHNFNVQYYSPHSQANPESVLMCNWKTNTEMACKKSSDVTFDHVISDQITLHRWPSVGNWGSRYVCQLVPSTGDILDPCELTFSEIKATAPRVNTTTTSSSLLENVYQSQREVRTLSIVAMVISCILLIVIVVVFCRHRIKKRIADWRKPKGKENGIEEDAVELAPPLVEPQVREEPGFTVIDSSTEEKLTDFVSRLKISVRKKKKKAPEDAEKPMLKNSVQTASTSQHVPPEISIISKDPPKKESKAERKAREENEKREAEQRKQEEEQRKRREEAEQRKQREEEEQKQREQAKQAEVTEKKSDKKKKK